MRLAEGEEEAAVSVLHRGLGAGSGGAKGKNRKKNDGPREGRARWGKETYCQVFSFLFVLE
jgi:hypothetical protein